MKFLFLCPRHGRMCELNYASCVAVKYIAPAIARMGHSVKVVLDPTPDQANKIIKEFKPDIVWWVGHGAKSVTTLEDVKFWIGDHDHCDQFNFNENKEVLKGVIADAHSCLTAACLGKSLTKNYGCKYYLGYTDKFLFMWCACQHTWGCACGYYNPAKGVIRDIVLSYCMMAPHEANLQFTVALSRGMSPEQAYGYCLERFDQWIKLLSSITPQNHQEAAMLMAAIHILKYDKTIVRLCKNGEYLKPETPREKPPAIPNPGFAVLNINTSPEGARIDVNGNFAGVSPVTTYTKPGKITIVASKQGYETARTTIYAKENKVYNVNITLKKEKVSEASSLAILTLAGIPLSYIISEGESR